MTVPPEIITAGMPPELVGLYSLLLALEALGLPPPTVTKLADTSKVSPREMRRRVENLERLRLSNRSWEGGGRCSPPVHVVRVRVADDGHVRKLVALFAKLQRCQAAKCARLALFWDKRGKPVAAGNRCTVCKQATRADRVWWRPALRLLRKGLSPHAVHARLSREGVTAPVWDHAIDKPPWRAPGIVTIGLREGLLGDEWRERQVLALGGGADEGMA